MEYVIGVDIGTQSTKALLVSQTGNIVARASKSYQVEQPQAMWAQQWPDVWLNAVKATIQSLMQTANIRADEVKALCVSSLYGGSGIPVDASIVPLYPCMIWMDRRADNEVSKLNANIDRARLEQITGNGIDSYYGFTKILWLKEHHPDIWAKTHYFLPPNSYVQYCLTGEIAVDHSSAGNIGGVYDMAARTWSLEMLERLGIPEGMMPKRLVASNEVVGGLLTEVARELGLAPNTPVVAGGVDAAMATLAAGVTQPGQHVAMIGTSMCWGFINPKVEAKHGLVAMPYVSRPEQDFYVFGGAITAGAAVSWFRDQFCQAEQQQAEEQGIDVHQLLEQEAQVTNVGANGLVFLPYLMGERSPIWDSKASGTFVGLSLYHRKVHLYRALLEGIAFALRHNMECGEQAAERLDDRLMVVGGAAHSDLWMQIIADVTGYDVYTIEQEVEAPLGAAWLAGEAIGWQSNSSAHQQSIQAWRTLKHRASSNFENKTQYDVLFSVYKQLYVNMKDSMHTLAQIREAE